MIRSYQVIAIRTLVRHKLTTLINILGHAIGVAFCILVLLFVEDELSYDNFHTKGDSIYRVAITTEDAGGKSLTSAYVPMPLLPAMCEDFPEVALGARCTGNRVVVQSGTNCFTETAFYTDPDFLKRVLLANIIAWPAAYFAASVFLDNYAYRIPLGPWIFLAAGLAALLLACVTIVGQILRAVRANPVESLRYE
jgi:hypothetical protein